MLVAVVFGDTAIKLADPNFAAESRNAKEAAQTSATATVNGPAVSEDTLAYQTLEAAKTNGTAHTVINGPVCIVGVRDGFVEFIVDPTNQRFPVGRPVFATFGPSFRPALETKFCKGNAFAAPPIMPPGLQPMIPLWLLLIAAALFSGWHLWAIPVAGTITRRAFLWEKNREKWSYNAYTGLWNRRLYKDVTGSWIVSLKPTRVRREVKEAEAYRAGRVLVPLAATAWAILTYSTTRYLPGTGPAVITFNGACAAAFFIALWQPLLLVPMAVDLAYITGRQGWLWEMVIDPPAQLLPAENFGPSVIDTPQEHAVQDDLGYKPSI